MSRGLSGKSELRKALLRIAPVAAVVAAADQGTKMLVLRSFEPGDRLPVIPGFFDLTLTFNPGAAFGFLANVSHDGLRYFLLGVATLLALSVVLYFLVYDYAHDAVAQGALALILGGAVGNIIDRVTIGSVVDFLDVYVSTYHWPVFNVADSAICIGVGILVLRRPKQAGEPKPGKEGAPA